MQVRIELPVQFLFNHHAIFSNTMFFTKSFAASIAMMILILFNFEFGACDMNANCKSKVLKMSLKHCLNDGVSRSKRDVLVISNHKTAEDPRDDGESRSRDTIPSPSWDQEYVEESRRPNYRLAGYQGFSFRPPASGDDLGMGLSYDDLQEVWKVMIERLPRAVENKEQTMRMITAYAASCCNENLGSDTCSDSANVINCP